MGVPGGHSIRIFKALESIFLPAKPNTKSEAQDTHSHQTAFAIIGFPQSVV